MFKLEKGFKVMNLTTEQIQERIKDDALLFFTDLLRGLNFTANIKTQEHITANLNGIVNVSVMKIPNEIWNITLTSPKLKSYGFMFSLNSDVNEFNEFIQRIRFTWGKETIKEKRTANDISF